MKKKRKETGRYCFPSIMAKMMKGVSQRTQYEATMMSIIFILLGIITMTIVSIFTDLSLFIKIMAIVNAIAAFIFLSSMLVTQFQQYQNYLAMMGIIDDYVTDVPQEITEKSPPESPVETDDIETQTIKFLGGSNEKEKSI